MDLIRSSRLVSQTRGEVKSTEKSIADLQALLSKVSEVSKVSKEH